MWKMIHVVTTLYDVFPIAERETQHAPCVSRLSRLRSAVVGELVHVSRQGPDLVVELFPHLP